MTEAIHNDYEVSSEGAVRHWVIPILRLADATPTATNPACVLSDTPGTNLTGTVLKVDGDIAVIDFTSSMVYRQDVRNVKTYAAAAEATFEAIDVGDPIFYDISATMPVGVYLSTSPLDATGAKNPLFGFRVPENDADTAAKGAGTASTQRCAVMQVGAGAAGSQP